jgi:hypothetical protein
LGVFVVKIRVEPGEIGLNLAFTLRDLGLVLLFGLNGWASLYRWTEKAHSRPRIFRLMIVIIKKAR